MAIMDPWDWVQAHLTDEWDDLPTLLHMQDHARKILGENTAIDISLRDGNPMTLSQWRVETAAENVRCVEALRYLTPAIERLRKF